MNNNTDNNTECELKYYSPEQFSGVIKKLNYNNKPLIELRSATYAKVFHEKKCCDCKNCCTCDKYYKYNTFTKEEGNFLFKNIAKFNCTFCTLDRIYRFKYCESYTFSSYDKFSSDNKGDLFSKMVKEPGCLCAGCCDVNLEINIPNENRMAGIVKFRTCCSHCCNECCKCKGCCSCCSLCKECCYQFYYCCDILGPNKEQVYTIYLKKCCLVPVNCCCYLSFIIKNQSNAKVGSIEANTNCCNLCGTSYTYNIVFPSDASPELKLTIINAVIAIDLFLI